MDGSNYDDLKAYRPGMKALKELGIHSPLLELEVTKLQIRSLAVSLGVASSDKPSAPCLATRLPYGATLDYDLLERIDIGEKFIRDLNCYNVRLRSHGDIIRIEIDQKDFMNFMIWPFLNMAFLQKRISLSNYLPIVFLIGMKTL